MDRSDRAPGRRLAAVALCLGVGILAMPVGAIIGGRTGGGMGWDRLADALGGAVLAGILGLVGGAMIGRRLSASVLRRTALLVTVAALLLVAFVVGQRYRTGPETEPAPVQRPVTRPASPAP